jgi:hypothetical protein
LVLFVVELKRDEMIGLRRAQSEREEEEVDKLISWHANSINLS